MRAAATSQLQLGELDIASINISVRSRDDIPQLLRGLQYIYGEIELREQIVKILAQLKETQTRYRTLIGCSFDKGFHSPENQIELSKLLEKIILPKKGRCNKIEKERESSEEFRRSRRQHSAVESGINALEVHGLDKCPDHGLHGFKRYIGLAIVARNIQKLGSDLRHNTRQQEKRKRDRDKLAA
ncbi:MAG: hypothetical protein GY817_05415 [bacterium]|nr:hypothetical protein [bacterium]